MRTDALTIDPELLQQAPHVTFEYKNITVSFRLDALRDSVKRNTTAEGIKRTAQELEAAFDREYQAKLKAERHGKFSFDSDAEAVRLHRTLQWRLAEAIKMDAVSLERVA